MSDLAAMQAAIDEGWRLNQIEMLVRAMLDDDKNKISSAYRLTLEALLAKKQ